MLPAIRTAALGVTPASTPFFSTFRLVILDLACLALKLKLDGVWVIFVQKCAIIVDDKILKIMQNES